MKNHDSISIVIPSYNSKQTINECLNSVLNQSYQGIQEVIVVDSSDDGTDEMVRNLFPNVKLIHLNEKTLPGAARNVGVLATNSEYIAFTDTDCIADYDWVENLMRRMKETNSVALGGAIINGTPESISGTLGYLSEFSFFLPERRSGFAKRLATANVCYKRSIFDEHKFIETHFAGEDTTFHWTILNNGGKLFFDQKVKITHKNRKGFVNILKHHHKLGEGAGIARIRSVSCQISYYTTCDNSMVPCI
jgi:glycosyltransferase involved in cell wall biosynthesis